MSPDSIVRVRNLTFGYEKKEPILKNVNFEIQTGEMVAIAGESGCGKTTLCYILKGLIPNEVKGYFKGDVSVARMEPRKVKISKLARKVGMVFQDLNAQLFSNTVQEEVQFGLRNLGMKSERALPALKRLGVGHLANKIPMNLSAGQKQRVILASIIALEPEILILDEPSIHLDPKSKRQLKNWLAEMNTVHNTTVLIASNDPYLIGELCPTVLYVKDGTIVPTEKMKIMEKRPAWRWMY